MEHIEEAGVHSGDSSCVLPPYSLAAAEIESIKTYTRRLALALNVIGLMNVQYAIKDGVVYVLEVNPRASRTVPFVSKATGVPLPKIAVGLMLGKKLSEFLDLTHGIVNGVLPVSQFFVKSPVFPFNKFPGVDPALGPEMRSTGEVMGVGENFGEAFAKAQLAAGTPLPDKGSVFISVNDRDKAAAVQVAKRFADFGGKWCVLCGNSAKRIHRHPHAPHGFTQAVQTHGRTFARRFEHRSVDRKIGAFAFRRPKLIDGVARHADQERRRHDSPRRG